MRLRKIKQTVENVVDKIDTNGDGYISQAEVLNPQNIKLILVTIISLMTPELIKWVGLCIEQKKYVSNGIEGLLTLIAVPFILIYFFKSIVDDYQGRLKTKDLRIAKLETDLVNEKADRREDNAKNDLNVMQMEGALKAKNTEIEWVKKDYLKD